MGVNARRGRKNDRKQRGDSLSTGSIEPPAQVQSRMLFFMQSRQNKGLYHDRVDLQNENCIQVSWAGPSISTQEVKSDI